MHGLAIRPREPEHADGDGDTAHHDRRETRFRRRETLVSSHDAQIPRVVVPSVDATDEHTDCGSQKRQTTHTLAPASMVLVDDGEALEEEVKRTIAYRQINRQQKDNGLVDEQRPRPRKRDLQSFAQRLLLESDVHFGNVDVARLDAELPGAFAEEKRAVCFGHEEEEG